MSNASTSLFVETPLYLAVDLMSVKKQSEKVLNMLGKTLFIQYKSMNKSSKYTTFIPIMTQDKNTWVNMTNLRKQQFQQWKQLSHWQSISYRQVEGGTQGEKVTLDHWTTVRLVACAGPSQTPVCLAGSVPTEEWNTWTDLQNKV